MIRVKNLQKSYLSNNQTLEILKNISMDIEHGEFVAIVGKSGSGKTTLLSLLAGLDSPTSGQIEIDGHAIEKMTEDDLVFLRRKLFGFIFQSYHLVPTLTAFENILVPYQLAGKSNGEPSEKKWGDSRAFELLKNVGLNDRGHHYPNQLSGGEQQRVAICRALMNEPAIIFADEPTGNLDSNNGKMILDLLTSLKSNRTLVLVTHDMSIAARADRTIELQDGTIVK